jgi:hypothetical protein
MIFRHVGLTDGNWSMTVQSQKASRAIVIVYNLQNLVNEINGWTIQNKIKLNVPKCKELIVDFSKDKRLFLPLDIGDKTVERVKSARVLGLIIQDDMKWNEHVNIIVKKAGKRLYMLRILKRSNANIDTLLTVYTTVIRPVLEMNTFPR